jgi:site-specific recombinase XerD
MASGQLELWTKIAAADGGGPALHLISPTALRDSTALSTPRLFAQPAHEPSAALLELDARAQFFFDCARATSTRTAYARDFAAFERWCSLQRLSPLPATSATLARYLTHLVEGGRKVSTVRRARIAIGVAHADAGLARPDKDSRIRTLERGMGRVYGTRECSASPLVIEMLEPIVETLSTSARADRDRVMLLLGFAGAFRSGELVALRIEDFTWHGRGMTVSIARSKEDPLAAGDEVEIGFAQKPELCAVRAVQRWITRVGEARGPLLRRVLGEHVTDNPMRARAVSRTVQHHATRVGLRGDYSSHSLRAGFATSAYARGLHPLEIQRHGRWHDARSLARYIDFDAMPTHPNPLSAIC